MSRPAHSSIRRPAAPGRRLIASLGAVFLLWLPVTAQALVNIGLSTTNSSPVAGGNAFAYVMTLTNDASAVSDLVATLPMPNSIMLQTISVAGLNAGSISCRGDIDSGQTVVCRAPTFPANASATITATVQVVARSSTGARTATARVVSSGVEDSAAAAISISVNAPLSLTKTSPAVGIAGDLLSYRLVVLNTGSSSAINPVLTDTLPSDVAFVSVRGTGDLAGACSFEPVSRQITCSPAQLASGSHVANITVEPLGNRAPGPLSNTANLNTGTGTIVVGTATASSTLGHSKLDIDKNAAYAAASDGVLVARYLFGLAPVPITASALGAGAQRTTNGQILSYLDFIRPQLDIDGDGHVLALTDGLLVIRHLLGLSGQALIAGAVGSGATRSTAPLIEAYLGSMTP